MRVRGLLREAVGVEMMYRGWGKRSDVEGEGGMINVKRGGGLFAYSGTHVTTRSRKSSADRVSTRRSPIC